MGAIIAKNSGSIVFNRCYYVEDEQLKTAVGENKMMILLVNVQQKKKLQLQC